jgi:hypothetical protein
MWTYAMALRLPMNSATSPLIELKAVYGELGLDVDQYRDIMNSASPR